MQFVSSAKVPSSIHNLQINFNPDGWGPVSGEKLPQFSQVPYSHFDKKEKFGRHADFVQQQQQYQGYQMNARQLFHQRRKEEYLLHNDFNFKHDVADDNTFQLVDTSKAQSRSRYGAKRNQQQQQRGPQNTAANRLAGRAGPQYGRDNQQQPVTGYNRGQKGRAGGRQTGRRRDWRSKQDRVASLEVEGDWTVIEEFDMAQLLKLAANIPKVDDLLWSGHLDQYDDSYDKLSTRTARPLRPVENKIFYDVTSGEDPVLERLAVENAGDVYATDAILARLMAAPRSVYSWDILVQKVNGMVFLDKRDNSNFDLLTVSESASDPPIVAEDVDEINHPENLSVEATRINQNFSQQVLRPVHGETVEEERKSYEPNPFFDPETDAVDGAEPASTVYRYRRFNLGSIRLVARCELHCWVNKKGDDQFVTCHALHEWDSKQAGSVNWRQKIDQQRGAVLATELKNNSCRLSRWAAQALLSGADQMRLGYVSRVTPTNALEHQVLATQFFKPRDFMMQMNLTVTNVWGIVKMLCELLMTKPDGKYVLLKDPNKPTLRLYSVPIDAFEEEDEDEAEEDAGEGGDEDEEDADGEE